MHTDRIKKLTMTLLLAAMVPFTTGCPRKISCEKARDMDQQAHSIAVSIRSAINTKQFSSGECRVLQGGASALNAKKRMIRDAACSADKGICFNATQLTNAIQNVAQDLQIACNAQDALEEDEGYEGGLFKYTSDSNQRTVFLKLKAAAKNLETHVIGANGRELLAAACSEDEFNQHYSELKLVMQDVQRAPAKPQLPAQATVEAAPPTSETKEKTLPPSAEPPKPAPQPAVVDNGSTTAGSAK